MICSLVAEVFFLFSLYDYDRSGQMDGLELMQLLTDFLTYHEVMPKSTDSVSAVSLCHNILSHLSSSFTT